MIISFRRAYVFVHIPKTGGTSLALALEERAGRDDILIGDTPKAQRRRKRQKDLTARGRLWKHSTLADIDGVLTPEEIARMFTFTLVRNPWDRVVSLYHWARAQRFDHPIVHLAQQVAFDAFVRHPHVQDSVRASPSASYMRRADGALDCDLFIRLEHFAEDAQPLWTHLGFELVLPHTNRSERPTGFQNQYTRTTRDIVAELCAEDIERFNYRFD